MGWVTSLVSGAASIGGTLKQKETDQDTAKRNQNLANAQADDALLRGTIEESKYRRQIAQVIGGQKAAFGARNVAVTGTALDLLGDTAQQGEENALTIRNNAAREAWGYRNQASEASRWGANQSNNANGKAIGTLLTSGSKAYGQWQGTQ